MRAHQVAWYHSRTGVGRAGAVLAVGIVLWAVLVPFVGPSDALWLGLGNSLLFEVVMALGERWTEPVRPAAARA
jgi:hypothetical protein